MSKNIKNIVIFIVLALFIGGITLYANANNDVSNRERIEKQRQKIEEQIQQKREELEKKLQPLTLPKEKKK